tara:strand:- start:1856 stop:2902 length:1047 start_codon:yes stop_codon:yes gene_type:complete
MTSSGLTWPEEAYYPLWDGSISVKEALEVRNQNDGEYRENPIYNSKKTFDNGYGIILHPVDNSTCGRRDCFRANSGQTDSFVKVADSVGLGSASNSNAKYTNTACRVRAMIDHLSTELNNYNMAIDQWSIASIEEVSKRNSLSSPDIIIHHYGQFHRQETRIFVKDGPRKPKYRIDPQCVDSVDDWILNITKFSPETAMNWNQAWPLLSRLWLNFDNARKIKLRRITESAEKAKEDRDRAERIKKESARVAEANRSQQEKLDNISRNEALDLGFDVSTMSIQEIRTVVRMNATLIQKRALINQIKELDPRGRMGTPNSEMSITDLEHMKYRINYRISFNRKFQDRGHL